jgi:glycosyltransferase involved in cell wall biosynthesis
MAGSMRILFIIRRLSYGGAQRQLITLANGLVHQGHAVAIIVYYPQGELEGLLDPNVHLFHLDKHDRWDLAGPLRSLLNLVYDFKPDILHGYLSTSNFLALFLKPFFPKIPVVWGKRDWIKDHKNYDIFQRLIFLLEPVLSHFSDLIIINSDCSLQLALDKGYPLSKSQVIYNGVDKGQFKINIPAGQRMREKWGVTVAETLIGIVGRIHREKDHATFIKAAYLFSQKNPRVRFVCVGTGETTYVARLKKLSRDLGLDGRILWVGTQADMEAVYNALDILVSSSFSESFSNVILEAMACGVLCVVTDVGDSAHIIGETGLVVPPCDPQALANGMEELVTRLDKVDHQLIRSRIMEKFSVETLVKRTEEVLSELLEL